MNLVAVVLVLAAGSEPLRVGISAPRGFREGAVQAALIQEGLSAALGRPVLVKTFADTNATADALAEGRVDAAWVAPAAYLRAAAKARVTPVAKMVRGASDRYWAVFVQRSGLLVAEWQSMRGKRVAWMAEESTSSVFARAHLRALGAAPATFFGQQLLVKDHAEACDAVLEGRADVAVTYAYDGMQIRPDGCVGLDGWKDLAIVASVGPIPNDLIAARAGLPAEDAAALRRALAKLGESVKGKKALAEGFAAEGFADAADADLEPVRKLLAPMPPPMVRPVEAEAPGPADGATTN